MYCVYKNYYISDPLHFHSQVKPEIKFIKENFLSLEIKILVNLYNIIASKQKKIMEAIIEKVSFLAQKIFLSS